jgi:hypothetical protein
MIKKLTTILLIIFYTWFGLSYMEVLCKNTAPNPQYSGMNLIGIMLNGGENK